MTPRAALRFCALALAGLAPAAPAFAADDARIVTRWYDPRAVVPITGQSGIQTTVAFADDEHIENVAVGDSSVWQVTPNKRANLLFVKPMAAKARTNMTVVTDQRTYLFDLLTGTKADAVYVLRFSYPAKPKAAEPAQVAAAPVAAQPSPTALNFAWVAKGDRKLIPARTFDDGRATYLSWPADTALPAILTRDAQGTEGPVNYAVKDKYVVVEGVPAELVLRAGKQMATLFPAARPGPTRAAEAAEAVAPGPAPAPAARPRAKLDYELEEAAAPKARRKVAERADSEDDGGSAAIMGGALRSLNQTKLASRSQP